MSQSDREYQKKMDAHNREVAQREADRASKDRESTRAFEKKMNEAAKPTSSSAGSSAGSSAKKSGSGCAVLLAMAVLGATGASVLLFA